MDDIVTDVGRRRRDDARDATRRCGRRRPTALPFLTIAALGTAAGLFAAGTFSASVLLAGGDQLSDLQAQATQILQQIESTGAQISALGQRYDQDVAQIATLNSQIAATEAKIEQEKQEVAKDQATLRNAAVNAYVTNNTSSSSNPIFQGSQSSAAAAQEYNQVAEGDLGTAVSDLHIAQDQLAQQQAVLQSQQQQAQAAANEAAQAKAQAEALQAQQNAALAQNKGQVAALIAQQQQARSAANASAVQQKITTAAAATTSSSALPAFPPPPSNPAAAAAVAAAESFLGVPYVYAGASRAGVDCSGLTMLAWAAAGVSLPHFSGGQMADSTPVPLSNLQPGDLLFYGPGGSSHVSMYIGSGEMIEAPDSGQVVSITGMRMDGFVGAGRP
jgi:cell wall-associated NlpC family hydrolase